MRPCFRGFSGPRYKLNKKMIGYLKCFRNGDNLMPKNNRLLYSNLIKLIIGLMLIIVSQLPIISHRIHISLLVVGVFIIGMSGDGFLKWYGEKK